MTFAKRKTLFMKLHGRGFKLWLLLTLLIQLAGAPHSMKTEIEAEWQKGRWDQSAIGVYRLGRSFLTDSGDIRRYYAYTNAFLGKPHYSYYVRTTESWREDFKEGKAQIESDSTLRFPTSPMVPYRDYLVEYPPGFFVASLLPALVLPAGDYGDLYTKLFVSLMILFIGVSIHFSLRFQPFLTSYRADVGQTTHTVWMFSAVACFALGTCLCHRFDPLIALLIMAQCLAMFSSHFYLFGALFALSVVCKGIPLLLAPIWMLFLWKHAKTTPAKPWWQPFAKACVAGLACGLLFAIPVVASSGLAILDAFRYHGERPLQLESTGAALLGLLNLFFPGSLRVQDGYGSANVIALTEGFSALSRLLLAMQWPALGVGLMVILFSLFRRMHALSREAFTESTLRAICTLFVIYMITSRVFSPQYLTWILPLSIFLSFRAKKLLVMMFVVVLFLSQLLWRGPWLNSLSYSGVFLLLFRNGLFFVWSILLFRSPFPQQPESLSSTVPVL